MSSSSSQEKIKILVLQGPNLNLLGRREPSIYGNKSLEDLHADLAKTAFDLGCDLVFFQSNHEGELIDRLHAACHEGISGVLVNPGGLGHTSVSLLDAFLGCRLPFVELHISNIHAREAFRHNSLLSPHAQGIVMGRNVWQSPHPTALLSAVYGLIHEGHFDCFFYEIPASSARYIPKEICDVDQRLFRQYGKNRRKP